MTFEIQIIRCGGCKRPCFQMTEDVVLECPSCGENMMMKESDVLEERIYQARIDHKTGGLDFKLQKTTIYDEAWNMPPVMYVPLDDEPLTNMPPGIIWSYTPTRYGPALSPFLGLLRTKKER